MYTSIVYVYNQIIRELKCINVLAAYKYTVEKTCCDTLHIIMSEIFMPKAKENIIKDHPKLSHIKILLYRYNTYKNMYV